VQKLEKVWETESEVEKVWESVLKVEKVCQNLRKYEKLSQKLRKFAKTWESMKNLHSVLKAKKVCKSMRNCAQSLPKVWENVLIAIFAHIFFVCGGKKFCAQKKKNVRQKKFLCTGKNFSARSTNFCEFCRLMIRVLPLYGLCFAALCNFWNAVQKSVAFF